MILLILGCTARSDSASTDTAPTDSSEPDPCGEVSYSGESMGTSSCKNGLCEVPGGTFWMGDDQELDRCPARQVTLSTFSINLFEVTNQRYEGCVQAGACAPLPECHIKTEDKDLVQYPAICATWQEAATFCEWTGGRLPTEAEWERAARGDDGAAWAWGSDHPTCNEANFREANAYCNLSVIAVGSHLIQSPYGLLDTVGNAWEWTADFYDADYYATAPDTDPPGPDECALSVGGERGACTQRVIRGGAFNTREDITRSANRGFASPDLRDNNLGFRCAFDP